MNDWIPKLLLAALTAIATILAPHEAAAQADWPSRPISLVVPFPPGGNSDNIGRLIGERIATELKASLIVVNKPGGTTQVGTELVAHSKPDGYTVLLGASTAFTVLPHLRVKLPYDPKNDFEPLGGIADYLAVIAVRKDLGVATMADLVKVAKASPGKLTWGSAGQASFGHIAGELLRRDAGVEMLHVPFKGSADAATALAGGQIDVLIDGTTVPLAKAGRVTALAVFAAVRHPELENVPTLKEAGLNVQLSTGAAWGLFVPKGTPAAIAARLSQALEKALADPLVRERLQRVSALPNWQPPAEFRKSIESDYRFYGVLLPSIGIRPEN
jgi:tripartite-type tricarboxylate transporter receptor subunit TctC